MRLLTRNELKYANTITMLNNDTAYPVENLYAQFKTLIAKATTANSTVTINWSEIISTNCFFFAVHNCNSITIKFFDVGDSEIYSKVLNTPQQTVAYYFNTITNIAKCTIELTSASEAYLGSFSTGLYYTPQNILAGYTKEYVDSTIFEESPGGLTTQDEGTILVSFLITNQQTDAADRQGFITAYKDVLKGGTFWLHEHEDIDTEIEAPLFGKFIENIQETKINELYTLSTTFMEAN